MYARPVDPRAATTEQATSRFWVVFWEGTAAEEWDLQEAAGVGEVLAWAGERAAGRRWTVYAVTGSGDGLTTTLIEGAEPFEDARGGAASRAG